MYQYIHPKFRCDPSFEKYVDENIVGRLGKTNFLFNVKRCTKVTCAAKTIEAYGIYLG
jgi:hypothetical protein